MPRRSWTAAPVIHTAGALARFSSERRNVIGWLGRHQDFRGLGLGEVLLFDAIATVAKATIRAHAIFADAIDDDAVAFYQKFGFASLTGRPRTLYLPVATALSLIG